MSEIIQKLKIPIIIMVAFGLILFLYNSFAKKPADDKAPVTKKPVAEAVSAESVALLLTVSDIKFNESFFSDAVFLTLRDFSQKIIEENKNRQNPFAPISAISASSTVERLGFEDSTDPAVATSTSRGAPNNR